MSLEKYTEIVERIQEIRKYRGIKVGDPPRSSDEQGWRSQLVDLLLVTPQDRGPWLTVRDARTAREILSLVESEAAELRTG